MANSFTLVQLRYFAVVAETESMTEAARRLNISQSALSTAIAHLEHELGLQLFIRRQQRGIVLSAAGRQFAQELRAFLEHADRIYDLARGTAVDLVGDLRVGVFAPLAAYRAPAILRAFEERYPRVRVTFAEGDLEFLRQQLLTGSCEIALMYDIGVGDGVDAITIEDISPHVIVPLDHPLAQRDSGRVTLAEMVDEPLILLDLPHTREYYLRLFDEQGLTPNIRHRVGGYETVRSYVSCGFGYSILNQRLPAGGIYLGRGVRLLELDGVHQSVRVVLARAAGVQPTRRSVAFERVCLEVFANVPRLRIDFVDG